MATTNNNGEANQTEADRQKKLDALATTALGPSATEIEIAAAANGVTAPQLTELAVSWSTTTNGPAHYSRNTRGVNPG